MHSSLYCLFCRDFFLCKRGIGRLYSCVSRNKYWIFITTLSVGKYPFAKTGLVTAFFLESHKFGPVRGTAVWDGYLEFGHR